MLFSRRARGIQNPERTPTVAEAEIDKNLVKEAALHRHFLAPLLSPCYVREPRCRAPQAVNGA